MRPSPRIGDHAILGDGRSAALVTRSGEVDWLCWPRFDSPAVFARILDPQGGSFSIAPCSPFHAARRYLPDTNVLETRLVTRSGEVVLVDVMPLVDEDLPADLAPEREILRIARCERGEVELEVRLDPRPGFGRLARRWRDAGQLGLHLEAGGELYAFRSEPRLPLHPGGGVRSTLRLRSGDVARFSFTHAVEAPAVLPPLGARAEAALERTVALWRRWAARVAYAGPFRDAVVRSALALKLLVFAPSGAIVAAPTTSLPERLGGPLNWDYRFCWLRDAAVTSRALFGLGFQEEAEDFVAWTLHSTSLTRPALRTLYDVYGRAPPRESPLGFAGHAGSRPVRVGNAARDQLQLDVYGEVVGAVVQLVQSGVALDRESGRMLAALGDYVCRHWRQPDDGLWEARGPRRHHTHSKVLCWAALDGLLALDRLGHLVRARRDDLAAERTAIAREIERRGFHAGLGSYVQAFDGDEVDAALLQLPWYGYVSPTADRMRETFARVERELGAGRGLLYRYRAEPEWREGAFGICGFWAAELLALGGGTADEAESRISSLLAFANDLGLLSEEVDPDTGEALGNFPQAFTHVGLVNACLTLQDRLTGREGPPHHGQIVAAAEGGAS